MQVTLTPIEKIVPYARNPRKNDGAVAKVAASLKEFGWRQPIVVDSEMVVVVGHTRLLAARQLGMAEVPVHVAEGLTPAQIKAYRLADNRVGEEADWDADLLALELGDLRDEDYDLDLTGFDEAELAGALASYNASAVSAAEHEGQPESAGQPGGAGSLAARFGVPPFSVLNAREGWWQDRKRAWLALGIQSELGRGEQLIPNGGGNASKARYDAGGGKRSEQ